MVGQKAILKKKALFKIKQFKSGVEEGGGTQKTSLGNYSDFVIQGTKVRHRKN